MGTRMIKNSFPRARSNRESLITRRNKIRKQIRAKTIKLVPSEGGGQLQALEGVVGGRCESIVLNHSYFYSVHTYCYLCSTVTMPSITHKTLSMFYTRHQRRRPTRLGKFLKKFHHHHRKQGVISKSHTLTLPLHIQTYSMLTLLLCAPGITAKIDRHSSQLNTQPPTLQSYVHYAATSTPLLQHL